MILVAFCCDEAKVLSKFSGVHAGQFFQWLVELIMTAAPEGTCAMVNPPFHHGLHS